MSTCFRYTDDITEAKFRKAMAAVNITEDRNDDTSKDSFCITNGHTFVWVYVYNGLVTFETFGMQAMSGGELLYSIADELDTNCICEHDEGFFEDDEDT